MNINNISNINNNIYYKSNIQYSLSNYKYNSPAKCK